MTSRPVHQAIAMAALSPIVPFVSSERIVSMIGVIG